MATCPRFIISENMYGSIDLTECVNFKFHLFLFKSDYPFKQKRLENKRLEYKAEIKATM